MGRGHYTILLFQQLYDIIIQSVNMKGRWKLNNAIESTILEPVVESEKEHVEGYVSLDIMKSLSIIFVIAYHTGAVNNNFITLPGANTYFNYFITTLLATCVPMFFFVNGFLLLNKPLNIKSLINKVCRMMFIYFFWGIITYPVVYYVKGTPFTFDSIWADFMISKTGYTNHLWFLSAMVGIYILYPLIKSVFDNQREVFNYFLIGIFIMSFGTRFLSQIFDVVNYNTTGELDWGVTKFILSFNKFSSSYGFAMVYFMLGGVVYKYKDYKMKRWISLSVVIVSMMISLSYGTMMSLASNELYDVVWSGYDIVPTITMVIGLFYFFNSFNYTNNGFSKLSIIIGRNSLGIYLLHNIIILTTRPIYMEMWDDNNFMIRYLYILLVLMITLSITLVLKKIPFINNIIKM